MHCGVVFVVTFKVTNVFPKTGRHAIIFYGKKWISIFWFPYFGYCRAVLCFQESWGKFLGDLFQNQVKNWSLCAVKEGMCYSLDLGEDADPGFWPQATDPDSAGSDERLNPFFSPQKYNRPRFSNQFIYPVHFELCRFWIPVSCCRKVYSTPAAQAASGIAYFPC